MLLCSIMNIPGECHSGHTVIKRRHKLLTVQSSGRLIKVLKLSVTNFFSGDVILGCYGPLQSARQLGENYCFAKFQNLTRKCFAAVPSILLFC